MFQLTWVAAIVLVIGCYLLYQQMRNADERRRARFLDRKPMPNQDFLIECAIVDEVQASHALEMRNIIANELEIPVERIYPSDRFNVELAPEKGWEYDDSTNLLLQELGSALRKSGVAELQKEATVKDYVFAVIASKKQGLTLTCSL